MNIAIIPASGIGDALILQIAAHQLSLHGHTATLFSRHLHQFGPWLPRARLAPLPPPSLLPAALAPFEAILLQHDNTEKAKTILRLRPSTPVYTFYTNYRETKHGPLLAPYDFPFDETRPMVANTVEGLSTLFHIPASSANGLTPPPGLKKGRFPRRIVLHPSSGDPSKNWPLPRFIRLFHRLQEAELHPLFLLSPQELPRFAPQLAPFPIHSPADLAELATLLYESGGFIGNDSGPAHLASYLNLPHLVIGKEARQMRLWRPGWHPGAVVTPPSWLPNWKGFRIREQKWKLFISVNSVFERFIELLKIKNKV